MEHEYFIDGWDISVMPSVRDHVVERMAGVHRDAIEHVVTKLHGPPCTNKSKETEGRNIADILHMFWLEFKDFSTRQGTLIKRQDG